MENSFFLMHIATDPFIWDQKKNKPHNCFIEGDTSTRINLGWFYFQDGHYDFTAKGMENYVIWIENQSAQFIAMSIYLMKQSLLFRQKLSEWAKDQ